MPLAETAASTAQQLAVVGGFGAAERPAPDGFARRSETYDGITRDVWQAGHGPAVIVIHEIPGLHPGVVAFARRLVDAGFTAVMPSLFGTPGREISAGYVTARPWCA